MDAASSMCSRCRRYRYRCVGEAVDVDFGRVGEIAVDEERAL